MARVVEGARLEAEATLDGARRRSEADTQAAARTLAEARQEAAAIRADAQAQRAELLDQAHTDAAAADVLQAAHQHASRIVAEANAEAERIDAEARSARERLIAAARTEAAETAERLREQADERLQIYAQRRRREADRLAQSARRTTPLARPPSLLVQCLTGPDRGFRARFDGATGKRWGSAEGTCPRPEHAGSSVHFDGHYGKPGHRRHLYRCVPSNGDRARRLTKLLPREEAWQDACEVCGRPVGGHEGPHAARPLPGLLVATRTGLTPAGDDELVLDQITSSDHLQLLGALRSCVCRPRDRRPQGAKRTP